jgi:chorismate mutase
MPGGKVRMTAIDKPLTPAEAFGAVVDEQRALYETLDEMGLRQRALIEAGDARALLELLGVRAGIVERIGEVASRLSRAREAFERDASVDAGVRARLNADLDRVRAMAERVAARDAEDSVAMEERRASLGSRIVKAARGRGAVSAYRVHAPAAARFEDRRA